MSVTGYLHARYAESLAEFGTPLRLCRSGGWVLRREIPGSDHSDAMGCYPLFACRDWSNLGADLDELPAELVSLALVTDPFGDCPPEKLVRCFPDAMFHYKDHFVVDLKQPIEQIVCTHHRRNAKKALASLDIRRCEDPPEVLDRWVALYGELIRRHGIRGIRAFSRKSFAAQLSVPGMTAFEAVAAGRTVGMLLWFVHDDVAYYHLGAHDEQGYRLGASFGLFWKAMEHFAGRQIRWLSLGAGAGAKDHGGGLTRFKRGWSTGTRPTYFCGRIMQPEAYAAIAERQDTATTTDYFPAYREGEFT